MMRPEVEIAAAQLVRMRGMNALYHQRFFSDIRFTTVAVLALFIASSAIDRRLFLLIPLVTLMGACQTAFDASYLIFSRQYASRLEQFINRSVGMNVLVAHLMEDAYLFPLDRRKVVTLAGGEGFTWFGFMTAFFTLVGAGVSVAAVWAGVGELRTTALALAYWGFLGGLTITAGIVGGWWFVGGEGERRLREVLDSEFESDPPA